MNDKHLSHTGSAMEQSEYQQAERAYKNQLKQGKHRLEEELNRLAADLALHLDQVWWDPHEHFDIPHRLHIRAGNQHEQKGFSAGELTDLPATKEIPPDIKRRLIDLLRRFDTTRSHIGFTANP